MSLDSARAVYPILVQLARDLSQAAQRAADGRLGLVRRLLPALQGSRASRKRPAPSPPSCSSRSRPPASRTSLPDLSALIIQKPKARSDFGNLIRPSDGWWEPYVARGEATVGDVQFWFRQFQAARDYADWPEAPFF